MITLKTRQQKIEFLKGLKTGKTSINDIVEDEIMVLLDCDDASGGAYDFGTGHRFELRQIEEWKQDSQVLFIEL